jgi:hypothetical protein
MSEKIENKLSQIPIVKQLVAIAKRITLKSLEGTLCNRNSKRSVFLSR